VATDIVHQHSARLDYYKGSAASTQSCLLQYSEIYHRNFTQFYSTKSERDLNLRKEYDNQMDYRKHLQAFIDRWRYNANRGMYLFAWSSISFSYDKLHTSCPGSVEDKNSGEGERLLSDWITDSYPFGLFKLPELQPPEEDETEKFK